MNLSDIREGALKEVFDALEEAFEATGTDYYIIGALARDVWYSRGGKTFRQTKDVDFAVLVGSQKEYEEVRAYLKEHKNFSDTKGNSFVMLTPEGLQVDILPFGEIEIDDAITVAGGGLDTIHVNGFKEVYSAGTEEVEMTTGHKFKIATLPSIVLLKLIAFDDRPEKRTKDARDIAGIIYHFFDLQADLIYTHTDLFEVEDNGDSLQDIAAVVIGREIKKIVAPNPDLLDRVRKILTGHIAQKEDSAFIRNMVAETGETVEKAIKYLENILASLN